MSACRLLIVGPQGSGKGTQGVRIGERFAVPVIATGDIFRANIAEGTELGQKVKAITAAGELVSDELTSEIVRDRLAQPDAAEGFLLDGYPRNTVQVGDLDAFLAEHGVGVDAVIELQVPREVSLERLTLRAEEQGRSDDTVESIAIRLDIYERETAPILDLYRERSIVCSIDGVGTLNEIEARIIDALAAKDLVPAAGQ